MIKGRRPRNTNGTKSSNGTIAASAKSVTDDAASPKRKDFKFDLHTTDATVSVALKNDSMVLRGGRLKTVDISRYLQPTARCKNTPTIQPVAAPRNTDRFIDITDENTCDSFDAPQPTADDDDVCISAITTRSEHEMKPDGSRIIPHRNNHNNNNNIFLQEPVLSLNFDKTPTSPNRPRLLIQSPSFIANAELSSSRFSSPSQPKSDSLWNGIASMANCHTNGSGLGLLATSANSAQEHPHALDLSKPTQVTQIDSTTASTMNACLHQEDSNSCDSGDSGVVILSGNEGQSGSSSSPVMSDSRLSAPGNHTTPIAERRKKPSTPHRILCPSPVKNAIVCLPTSTGGALGSSPLGSIHKSRRGSNKSRKRLNAKHAPHENAPDAKPLGMSGDDSSSRSTSETNTLKIHDNATQATAPARQLIVLPPPSAKGAVVGGNKKITEFYPVRRSVRKTKKEVQVERDRDIELAIREGREEGLQIEHFEGKGRGIVTTRTFSKGEFVVEYIGDLITVAEAKQREQKYAEDDNTGCYMYYFKHKNIQHCIDATAESGKLGRLVNHSRNGNLVTKTVLLNNRPHLVLIAKDDIEKGVEITYDYGDRSKEALQYYPWLAL